MRDKLITKEKIIVICLFLSPLLFYGYTADDRQHVLQHILQIERGLWSSIELIYNDVLSMERFFPFHILLYSTFFKIFDYSNAWIYHAIQILLNILAYKSFARWIKSYFNIKIEGTMLLIFLTTIQFRVTYSDPIVSYFGLMQIIAIAQFEGIYLKKYLTEGNGKNGIKWLITLTSQLLLYEMTVFLVPITVYYLYENHKLNRRKCLTACIAGVTILVIYFAIYAYIKSLKHEIYTGTSLSLSIRNIISTTIIEAFGSLPLTYVGYIASQKMDINGMIVWGIYVVIMGAISITIINSKRILAVHSCDFRLVKYGALIWVCSAFSIALSERYQKELEFGLTYLVSYMQNFGYVMVVYYLIRRYEVGKILIVFCILTFIFNVIILIESNKIDGAKRIAMEVLTDNNININFNYTTLILNEKIMQDDEKFKINVGNNIKKVVYIKVNELDRKNIKFEDENVGIAIVRTERYGKASMIIGRYDLENSAINNANIFTKNINVAKEEGVKYNGVIQKIKNRENSEIFMVNLNKPVRIDTDIKGKYR
jgi:hypothetical protein